MAAVIVRQESLLLDHEAANIDRWLAAGDHTRAWAAAKIDVSPSYLNRVLGAQGARRKKKRQSISLPLLRAWMHELGMPLAEVFAEPVDAPRPLTLEDVRRGMVQASVNLDRWAKLLSTAATQPADAHAVSQAIEARSGIPAARGTAGPRRGRGPAGDGSPPQT